MRDIRRLESARFDPTADDPGHARCCPVRAVRERHAAGDGIVRCTTRVRRATGIGLSGIGRRGATEPRSARGGA
ncbi:TPA: hypothetical protein ACYLKV_006356, partial [Burkholderia cenocepacia]